MFRRLWAILALCLCGCPQHVLPGNDAGQVDAGSFPPEDAGADAGALDAGLDAGHDGGAFDAGHDAGTDAGTLPTDGGRCGYAQSAGGASGLDGGWAQPLCLDGWCWVNPLPFGLPLRTLSGSGPQDVWAVTRDTLRAVHFDGGRWDTWSPDGLFGTVASAGPGHAWLTQGQDAVETRPNGAVLRVDAGSLFLSSLWARGEEAVVISHGADPQNSGAALLFQRDAGAFSVLHPVANVVDGTSVSDFWVAQNNTIARGPSFVPVMSGGTAPGPGVPGNTIAGVAADGPSRAFWAGTDGVFVWNASAWTRVMSLPVGATAVQRAASGAIWAVAGEVYRLPPSSSTWEPMLSPQPSPVLWAANDQEAWVSAETGLARHTDAGWEVPWSLGAGDVLSAWFATAQDGWMADLNGGLFHWDGTRWARAGYCVPGPLAPAFTALHGTAADDVWAAGQSALMHFDGGTWTAVAFPLDLDGGLAYASRVVAAAHNDVWLLTATGLHRFDGQRWTTTSPPFSVSGAKLLWGAGGLSAVAGGLWHFDGTHWSQTTLPFSGDIAQATMAPDGTVWLIAMAGSVWKGAATGPFTQLPVGPQSSLSAQVFAFSIDDAVLQSPGTSLQVFSDAGVTSLRMPLEPGLYAVVQTSTDLWAFGQWGAVLRRPR